MLQRMLTRLQEVYPEMVSWRRHFHQYPELSFQEGKTAHKIAEILIGFGMTVKTGVGGNGVIGILQGKQNGKTIAFRADFDALPITDEKEVEYRSKVHGVMHACGHDGHTAILLGVAKVLSAFRNHIKGKIIFIFQHAEETLPGGASSIIAAGGLDGVDVIFGAHLFTDLPLGKIGLRQGPIMAAVDVFKLTIQGKGGHGAKPHETVDSVVVGSQIVNQLQQIVSRRVDPLEPAVVTVGVFQAGTAFNIIADKARIEGTVRSFNPLVREKIEAEIRRIVKGVCESSHASFTMEYTHGYPALFNHKEETALVKKMVENELGFDGLVEIPPRMAAEDFAYYVQKVPGAFFMIGAHGEGENTCYANHHPKFDFEEKAMEIGGKVFLRLAAHYVLE